MRTIVYIEKDELNGIAICRDNYFGVCIQVIRFIDQLIPNENQELVTHKKHTAIHTIQVIIKDKDNFKDEVEIAITQAKDFLACIRLKDKAIEGVLNDYHSQCMELNG